MKPPKCRLCGHEHALGAEHVFPDTPSGVSRREVVDVSNTVANKQAQRVRAVANANTVRSRRWRAVGPNRDAYNDYQRLYMQTARAVAAGRADRWPRAV